MPPTGPQLNLCVLEYSTLHGHGYLFRRKIEVLLFIINWLYGCCIFLHPCRIIQHHYPDAGGE